MSAMPASVDVLWVGSALFGLGMAACYPSTIVLATRYITITGRKQAIINAGACLGEVVLPIAIAQLFQNVSPRFFMFGTLVASLVSGTVFVALRLAGGSMIQADADSGEYLASNDSLSAKV
jgi:MFS family permease